MQSFKKEIKLIILVLLSNLAFTQNEQQKSLQETHSFYIKGETIIIGNQILQSKDADLNSSSKAINDEANMIYVDIDNDPNTFSSSTVILNLPEDSEIHFAALYWTGTYPGKKGKKRLKNNTYYYEVKDGRDHSINQVLLKIDKENYSTIKGDIIYDDTTYNPDNSINNAPYLSKAIVTNYFQKASDSLTITVANVPATQGYIEGGSTAGWFLFIVLENDKNNPKYINLFEGYQSVFRDQQTIQLKGFQATNTLNSSTKFSVLAIDGDRSLKNDQVKTTHPTTNQFVFFNNHNRDRRNVFNSTIDNDAYTIKRNPSWSNTLGFDIAQFSFPTSTLFPENTSQLDLTYATKNDRYSVLINVFETEINEIFENEIINQNTTEQAPIDDITVASPINTSSNNSDNKSSIVTNIVEDSQAPTKESPQQIQPEIFTQLETQKEQTLQPGFYLVTNAFSNLDNVTKWKQDLSDLGFQPLSFLNPENGLTYVYLAYDANDFMLQDMLTATREIPLLKETWIKEIK